MRRVILVGLMVVAFVASAAALAHWWIRAKWTAPAEPSQTQQIASDQSLPWESTRKWLLSFGPGRASALRLQVIRPGVILPPGAETYPPAPEDLQIVVTRRGNEPAQIEVRQGDRQWKVTEEQLDRLPPDVRLHVQRPLGWVLEGPAVQAAISGLLPATPGARPPTAAASSDRIERRLEELNTRVEALLKSIEAMERPR